MQANTPWEMVLKQTHGDVLSRMQQAAAILIRQGVEPAGMEALLQRIRALSELSANTRRLLTPIL
jgi:hypothetical protein